MAKNSPIEMRTSRMAYCSKSPLPSSANWTNRFQSISPAPSDRVRVLTIPVSCNSTSANSTSLLTAAERGCIVRANGPAPSGHPQAFKSASRPGRALTVREVGALSDFDDIAVRIADVTAYLAVLGDRLGDELSAST